MRARATKDRRIRGAERLASADSPFDQKRECILPVSPLSPPSNPPPPSVIGRSELQNVKAIEARGEFLRSASHRDIASVSAFTLSIPKYLTFARAERRAKACGARARARAEKFERSVEIARRKFARRGKEQLFRALPLARE